MKLNDYQVPDKNFLISSSMVFDSEDLSGETSSSSSAHKGIKPKELSGSFVVAYNAPELLSGFDAIASAVDTDGDLVIYEVTDQTANALNVRQAYFIGQVDVREQADINAWKVSFKLREHLSVPEKMEDRQETETVEPEQTEGQIVAAPAPATEVEQPDELTRFEKVLTHIDNALA